MKFITEPAVLMRIRFLTLSFLFTVFALFAGMANIQAFPEKAKHANSNTLSSDKSFDNQAKDSVVIAPKSEASETSGTLEPNRNRGTFTQRLFPGLSSENLRKLLLDWKNLFPDPIRSYYVAMVGKAFFFPVALFLMVLILALMGNLLVVTGILFLSNRIMNYERKEKVRLRIFFEKTLTDLMLQVTNTQETIQILSHPYLKENYNLLIDILMEFQKSFRGDADRQIIELYQGMDLGQISYNKTFAIFFYKQIQGIHELANMHPYHATEMIASRLNDPDDIVRTESQICYPHVNKESPFEFLSILEMPFSEWAQLNIYYYIKIHEMPVPSFNKWLGSGQINVVNFSILMITLFQQQEHAEQIIGKLKVPNETTRHLAIVACGELHLFDSKAVLKESFLGETAKNQLEITRVFQSIGDETDIPFLETIVRNESIPLRLEGCRTLYFLGENGKNHLERINQSLNDILSPFIAHIKDQRN